MKTIFLIISLFTSLAVFSQYEFNGQFGIYGVADIPFKSQMPKMSPAYGVGINFDYKPINRIPVFIELKGNLGLYDYRTSTETFVFDETSSTETEVTFSSGMHKIELGAKAYFTNYYKPVRGYVTPQVGYNFLRTRVRIADPEDEDDCQPLSNRVSQKSSGFTYGGEIGMEVDLMRMINDRETDSRLFLSCSFMKSAKKIDYVNTRFMNEHEHGIHDEMTTMESDNRPITVQFVNLTNDDLHEHKVAEIYSTYLQFFTVKIGYVWYF